MFDVAFKDKQKIGTSTFSSPSKKTATLRGFLQIKFETMKRAQLLTNKRKTARSMKFDENFARRMVFLKSHSLTAN